MLNFFLKNKFVIGLVLVVVLCLWQLSFFVYISKWDNIDAYLPYRFFISDYLWHGKFPFWNPFQNLGQAAYSDLQSGIWYPISWIIMLFGKYTIGSLSIEILSCYIIAAFGFYKLSLFLYNNSKVSFLMALSYALCGFAVGSSQLLTFLIGIAWLPWIIYAILKFFMTLKYKYALLTALFVALCTSGASPPFTIILVYSFFAMFIYNLWKHKLVKKDIVRIFVGGSIIITISSLLLLPYINSFIEFFPYFSRADKLPYEKLGYNTFSVNEYISFLFPFSVLSDTPIFEHTDLTLRNGYFGIVGLVYLGITLFYIRNKYFFPLIICAVLSLLLAAGSDTPFYRLVYKLPGLGLFKHTSFFRIYFIFSCLLLAGFAIKERLLGELSKNLENKIIKVLFFIVFIVTIVAYLFSPVGEMKIILGKLLSGVESFDGSFLSHVLINGILLSLLLILWFFLNKKGSFYWGLFIIVFLDFFIQTQLSAPKTVFNKISYEKTADFFQTLPNEINQTVVGTKLKNLDEKQDLKKTDGFWRNISTYNKTLSYVGYNPMQFISYNEGEINGELKKVLENEILFFPKKMGTKIKSAIIGYNEFTATILNETEKEQWLVLNQNYHNHWKAFYNNKPLPVRKVNKMIMGVKIKSNSSGIIQFIFESTRTKYALTISLLTYLSLIFYFIRDAIKNKLIINLK